MADTPQPQPQPHATDGTPVIPGGGAALLSPPLSSASDVIQQQTSAQDYVVLRFAVIGLLLGVVLSLVGVLLLAGVGKESPEGVLSIGSACVGALATMLVRPPLFPPGRGPNQASIGPPLFDRRRPPDTGPRP